MTKGHPDWFGSPVFPRQGAATEVEGEKNSIPNDTVSLVSLTGKGVIYNLQVTIAGEVTAKDDDFILLIDGDEYLTEGFSGLLDHGHISPTLSMWHVVAYYAVTGYYSAVFSGLISYEDSIVMRYKEDSGNTFAVFYRIRYSKIG